jgi:inorganic pyrophosphatase
MGDSKRGKTEIAVDVTIGNGSRPTKKQESMADVVTIIAHYGVNYGCGFSKWTSIRCFVYCF